MAYFSWHHTPHSVAFNVLRYLSPRDILGCLKCAARLSMQIVDMSLDQMLDTEEWQAMSEVDISVDSPAEVLWLQIRIARKVHGRDVNQRLLDVQGEPPLLHWLMQSSQRRSLLSKVRLLLSEGADVNCTSAGGASAIEWFITELGFHEDQRQVLHHTVPAHELAILRALLDAGASSEVAFTHAVLQRWTALVKEMLHYGVDVNCDSITSFGDVLDPLRIMLANTSVYWVGHWKDPPLIRLLIENGAIVNIDALEYAAENFAELAEDGQLIALDLLRAAFPRTWVDWVVEHMKNKLCACCIFRDKAQNPLDIPARILRGEAKLEGICEECSACGERVSQAQCAATFVDIFRILLAAYTSQRLQSRESNSERESCGSSISSSSSPYDSG